MLTSALGQLYAQQSKTRRRQHRPASGKERDLLDIIFFEETPDSASLTVSIPARATQIFKSVLQLTVCELSTESDSREQKGESMQCSVHVVAASCVSISVSTSP